MKIKRETGMEIWKAYFGNKQCVFDPFNNKMCKTNYAENGNNAWDIDHIWPENSSDVNASPGANIIENVQPLAIISNRAKSNNLQGKIFDVTFAVSKVTKIDGYVIGRMSVNYDGEWVWAYDEPIY